MGLTRDFFSQPIVIPCTILNSQLLEGELSQVQEKLFFKLRRETNSDSAAAAMASIIGLNGSPELRFTRFCNLLAEPPMGFEDFPMDDKPLSERASEYFAGAEFEPIVRAVMIFYDRALYPAELFG